MSEFVCKAIIYKDLEDVYGPCGCGMDLATLPVLLPEIGYTGAPLAGGRARVLQGVRFQANIGFLLQSDL